jgi:Icc protein
MKKTEPMFKFKNSIAKSLVIMLILILSSCGIRSSSKTTEDFSFVFMSDIHVQFEQNAPQGFKQAIDSINKINPDFVITGGDLIMDALGQSYGRADSLYNLFGELTKNLKMPVYNTMGNHEIYGLYSVKARLILLIRSMVKKCSKIDLEKVIIPLLTMVGNL